MKYNVEPYRVLIVDDNPAIHEDYRKILLGNREDDRLREAESILFNTPAETRPTVMFELDSAFQGREALEKVQKAVLEGRPYALAFVDVRMPPGWDGVETLTHLWQADPALQAVICTAYSDYSWSTMTERLGASDNFVILKKPFDNIEVLQLAHAMTKKWLVTHHAQLRLETLESMVRERTRALQSMNDELRRSEERFSKTFRASPAALALQTFGEERFVDVNDAFLQMTGFTREELIGRTPMDLALLVEYGDTVPFANGQSRVRNLTAEISTKTGDLRQALVSLERIMIGGEPHVLLLAQDISDRLQLEAQLRQSQKMEAIGQLAAGVAHDFNNLLTIIQGHSSLQLAIPGHNQDLTASLQQIEQAAEKAAELTRQLLAFSRRQIMRPRILDLTDHLRRLSSMLRRMIGERVEFNLSFTEDNTIVCADPTSVEQIVINLVINARDAMPGGGTLTLGTHVATVDPAYCRDNPEATSGQFVCLTVKDSGVGMDEATRSRIFEPFFTTKELNKGTGMGLAMVYGIARQHEGWVEVTTALGRGAEFRVFFPLASGTLEHKEKPAFRTGAPERSHTILIVEDDHAVRGLVKEVLVHHNYEVLEAENADMAFEVWEEHRDRIELLLTDMVMPGSANGLELADRLLTDRPELKVIYTSGYSTELFKSRIELQDGVNYLPKPYMSSKLTSMLRNALEPELAAVDANV